MDEPRKMFSPADADPQSHIGMREHFQGIVGRNVSDYLMQSAHRHHIRLSQMADAKANMIITVSSVVLTLSLGRASDPELRVSLLILAVFTLAALLLAILAVLPKYRSLHLKDSKNLPPHFNVMFFAHFSELPREEFFALLGKTLRHDAAVYETLANDLYGLGLYLARHKYRYLRLSYLFFLGGFVSACVAQLINVLWP
jgi:hypothetical protein